MKKALKRTLATIMTVVMILTAIPFSGIDFGAIFAPKASAKDISSYSVGDTITYGSYPQSRVTDSSLISALETAGNKYMWVSYNYYSGTGHYSDGKMQPDEDMMWYKDIPYNGNVYRAVWIKKYRPNDTGYRSTDGTYQDDNGYYTGNIYYFRYDPLTWRVLDPAEGFVMCTTAIDAQAYNNYIIYNSSNDEFYGNSAKTYYASDWANSSLRYWLNNDFYSTAFSSTEKSQIGTTYNENKSTDFSEYNSANTSDKIFLLSYNEVLNSKYGFSSDCYEEDDARQLKSTDYAKCQGCYQYTGSSTSYYGNSCWRLRSPCNSHSAASVSYGYAHSGGSVDGTGDGIVPAFKFNPKSKTSDMSVGDTFEFGSYPQSRVTDSSLISALETAGNKYMWVSYNYYSGTGNWRDGEMQPDEDMMWYKDIPYNGNVYRAVWIKKYRPYYTGHRSTDGTYQDDNGYYTGNIYYFRYDPLTWRVLDPAEGFVMCTTAIDAQAYNNYIVCNSSNGEYYGNSAKTYYASDWANSSLRYWLNNDFYSIAFSSTEKSQIGTTYNENKSTYNSKYESANTSDKIFLLSYNEVLNSKYGFSSSYSTYDPARQLKSTDYAQCQGCYKNTSTSYYGNSWWRLRSPYGSDGAAGVGIDGYASSYYTHVSITSGSIVPAFKFNPKSTIPETYDNQTYSDIPVTFWDSGVVGHMNLSFAPELLCNDSINYNHNLARLASQFVTLGYSDTDYKFDKDKNGGKIYADASADELKQAKMHSSILERALKSIGFDNISMNLNTGRDQQNYFFATKNIKCNGEIYTLVCAALIGSHGKQWYSDFDPYGIDRENNDKKGYAGTAEKGTTHLGFADSREYVYAKLNDYIKSLNTSNDVKLLLTGHSRGAAGANLLGAKLIDNGSIGGKTISPSNIFTFTFATPNATVNSNKKAYNRIFNVVNPEDFVTKVLPTAWGDSSKFKRYGITFTLPSRTNSDSEKSYLNYLKAMNKYYNALTDNDDYSYYPAGESTVYNIVKDMTGTIHSLDEFYNKPIDCGDNKKVKMYDFFTGALCPFVSNEDGGMAKAGKYIAAYFFDGMSIDTSGPISTIGDIGNNFGLLVNRFNVLPGKVLKFFINNQGIKTGVNQILELAKESCDEVDNKIVQFMAKLLVPSDTFFAEAHMAETYCAFMMSMTSAQVQDDRKGFNHTVNCPVDIEVYNKETGKLVGRIKDNVVDETIAAKDSSIVMYVDGDSKSFWLPSDGDYEVKLIGNDKGTMDYTVATVDSDIGETERINFFDVAITDGLTMTGEVTDENFVLENYTLEYADGKTLKPTEKNNDVESVAINTSASGNGTVSESMTATSGDYVTVSAVANDGYMFAGWYNGSTLVSSDDDYSFVAKENVSLVAKFGKIPTVTLSASSVTVKVGKTAEVSRTVSNPDNLNVEVKYAIKDKSIATAASSSGGKYIVTGVKAGSTILQVLVCEKGTKNVISKAEIPVTVENNGKVKSVSLGSDRDMKYKDSVRLNPKVETEGNVKYKVEYKSSNTKVATVDNNGNVYGAKSWGKKTAAITCTVTDEYGNQVSDSANVTCGYAWWQWIIGIVLFGWIWY